MKYLVIRYKFSIGYVFSVVLINAAFAYVPNFTLPDGNVWSIGSIVAGLVFIARDFAQREVGHIKVFWLMLLSGLLSYVTSNPYIAVASIFAFAISEVIDWAVYTLSKGGFKARVITSSLIGVPIDTLIFLSMIDSISAFGFFVMTASKLLALFFLTKSKV